MTPDVKAGTSGFSIIELVTVIILVSIISLVIFSRLLSSNTFNEAAARDGLISALRFAQQAALGRSAVTFEIDASGDDWAFTTLSSSTIISTIEVPADDVTLETGSAAATTDTCSSGTTFNDAVASDFELAFDSRGNLTEFTNNSTTEMVDASFNGVRICINDTSDMSVCVSPAGYAFSGDCVD